MSATRWRRDLVAGLLLAVAAASAPGCSARDEGTVRAGGGAVPAAGPAGEGPGQVTDARLVADGLGWATGPDGLFVTTDAGAAWRRWALPVTPRSVLGVALLGPGKALVASNEGTAVRVLSTGDAGRTWKPTELGRVPAGPAAGQFAQDGERVAGLLVQRASSSNFSLADWYATGDGGVTWTRHEAPAAGAVSTTGDGTLWLAGGPARNLLFTSADGGARWSEVALPRSLPADARALEPPTPRPDGRTILPVTLPGEGKASVVFLSTDDRGRSWDEVGRAEVPGTLGRGVAIPTSPGATPGTLLVAAPDGSQVLQVPLGGGAARPITSRGLARGVVGLRLTSGEVGWATVTTSSCGADKTGCSSARGLLVTRNGGRTWQPVTGGAPG